MGDHGAGHLSARRRDLPIMRTGPGTFKVHLDSESRQVLREIISQLRTALAANPKDPAFRRLFPPAHADDAAAEKEFRDLVGPELESSKMAALEVMSRTAGSTELSEEEMEAWARALNDIRLWMGTMLDVTEDELPMDEPPYLLYQVLTELQALAIEALLGEEDDEDDEDPDDDERFLGDFPGDQRPGGTGAGEEAGWN